MPPKKKAGKAVKAPVKKAVKAPAKRPVGRPRKPLGTRVSDVDLLANVGSTKPMPRRIGRDALEQQRARLRYAVDYPGRRFTERMTRALQDSFATGSLPYGVSLRAPADFKRPYTTTFEPIAGMPVWPAINVPPNADAEDAYRLLDAAVAAASAAPDPAVRPTKRAKRSTSGPNPGYVRDPTDTSEVYVPDTSVADRQAASREHMNKLAVKWQAQRRREIDALRDASFVRRNPIQDVNEELRRQNAAVSFPPPGEERIMAGIRNPPVLRSDQERALAGLPPRRRPRTTATTATGPQAPPPGEEMTADRSAINVRERAQQLRELLSRLPPPGDVELTPDRNVSERAQKLGELRSQRPRWPPLRRSTGLTRLTPAQQEAANKLSSALSVRTPPPSRPPPPPPGPPPGYGPPDYPPPPPPMTQEETENAIARAVAINDQIHQIDQALQTQPSRGIANLLGMQRQTLEDARASIIDPVQVYPLTVPPPPPPPPPPQNIMVGVPDPVREDEYLNNLRQAEQAELKRLTRLRAGKSIAEAQLNIAHLRGLIRDRVAEVSRLTPSSEPSAPAPASVPQSIVVPGTEAPAVIPSNQEAAFQRASQDANDRRRLEEENARLREVNRLQELAMERAASSLQAQEQLRANEAAASQADPTRPRLVAKPPETAEAQTYVDSLDLIRRASTKRDPSGPRVGTVDAKIARGEPVSLEDRQRNFERTVDANQRAEELLLQKEPKLEDIRAVRRLVHLGPEQKQNLDELIALRTNQPPPVRVPREPPLPPIVTAETLARPPMVPFSGQVSINPDVLVVPVSNPDPPQTVRIPPRSNPPEPSSQDGPATGAGLQHVTAATFPSRKWTTASSLRWLRSNGLHPIRKSTKINGAYSYALQSPAGYSSFNSVKMSHKNKDFTIVYGTPK